MLKKNKHKVEQDEFNRKHSVVENIKKKKVREIREKEISLEILTDETEDIDD